MICVDNSVGGAIIVLSLYCGCLGFLVGGYFYAKYRALRKRRFDFSDVKVGGMK